MPRYHFHVYDSFGLVEDEEGRELPSVDAVRREALKGVRSILSDELKQGRLDLRGRVEVKDGDGSIVLTLHFREAVELLTG